MLNNWIHVEQSLVNTGKERAKVSLLFTWAEGNVANQREHLILLLANIHIQKANKQSVLKSYTQYIPLPISDLDSWLKTPSIYVFDCSAAGGIFFMIGLLLAPLDPQGIAFYLELVKHMRLFHKVLNFLQMCLRLVS
ncbi:uncharacterized protein LOC133792287 [Humulus lupulus]|uniref:uncharacterized protein LOC133792287 n=1 Tax=Humulus lupulus TaxID=3486 RepID=UPI002B40C681|nr:uncharacterized protein LOC133792287 [Humulus lupulus]